MTSFQVRATLEALLHPLLLRLIGLGRYQKRVIRLERGRVVTETAQAQPVRRTG